MLQNKTIAVFMDVDNCVLSFDNYKNALDQISSMGKIVSCKLYGVSDRRNREIIADANDNGYDMAFAMRIKKRNTRVFDNRILIDVVEKVVANHQIDAVAIVSAPADMVYLYRFLQKREVAVIALDNVDEDSVKLVDEILDLGQIQVLKFPQQKPQKTVDDVLEEAVAQAELSPEDKNAKLQDEIARLREENGIVLPAQEEPIESPEQEESPLDTIDEQVIEESCPAEQEPCQPVDQEFEVEQETLGGQAQCLLDEIAKLREESETQQPIEQDADQPSTQVELAEEVEDVESVEVEEQQPAFEQPCQDDSDDCATCPQKEQTTVEEEQCAETDQASAQDTAEDQLISQIENLRANLTDDSNDEELIAQIKLLLDGLE